MTPSRLDYLFVSDFKDGSRYFQTPADASVVHPLTRSAFFDVCQRLEDVKQFTLVDRHNQHEHTVFLEDGHFKTDGRIIPCPRSDLINFRLIYVRRCQIPQGMNVYEVDHEYNRVVAYFIGWQANQIRTGQNFQMLLEIPPLGSLQKPALSIKG